MSLKYQRSFEKCNSMQKSMRFQASHNSGDQSLQYCANQTEANQFFKVAHQPQHQRFISQLHQTTHLSLQQSNFKHSTPTQASKDYFQAIQNSLLLQNQNLKNHNKYLLEQTKKLFIREKVMKRMLLEHQNTIKTLQSIIQDSQINLRRFFEDMVVLIEELQVVNSTRKEGMLWNEENERQKEINLYLKEATEPSSHSIFHSLENIKNIFSQSEIMDEKRSTSNFISSQQHENPESFVQDCKPKEDEQNYNKNEENNWQTYEKVQALPILCSFKNKILDLCMKISSENKITNKDICLKKQRTMSQY